MNVPCKLCYLFQEYVRRFPSLGRNVQSIAQNNCLASVNAKKKSKRLQRTQNGYVPCKSNLRGAIHESLSQPQLSLPGVRQKVSLTQHVCPANCMLAAPNYCRKYIPENIKTLTWKTCRSLHAQSCAVQEEKARITVSSLVVSWVSILLHGCLQICAGRFCHECSLQHCYLFQESVGRIPWLGACARLSMLATTYKRTFRHPPQRHVNCSKFKVVFFRRRKRVSLSQVL